MSRTLLDFAKDVNPRTAHIRFGHLARIFHDPGTEPGYRGCVAQVSNLLYRRPPVGRLYLLGGIGGLEIRDTAGWKPALHRPAGETREISGLGSPRKLQLLMVRSK